MSQAPDQHLPPHGLSSQYWSRLSDRDRALYQLIRPIPSAIYSVQYQVADVETFIATMERDAQAEGGSFELEPDFQRGHVWSDAQRSAWLSSVARRLPRSFSTAQAGACPQRIRTLATGGCSASTGCNA